MSSSQDDQLEVPWRRATDRDERWWAFQDLLSAMGRAQRRADALGRPVKIIRWPGGTYGVRDAGIRIGSECKLVIEVQPRIIR